MPENTTPGTTPRRAVNPPANAYNVYLRRLAQTEEQLAQQQANWIWEEPRPRAAAAKAAVAPPEDLKVQTANTFRVGCDPEFVVLDGMHLINVNKVLPKDGPIGSDHNGSCAELRPMAARSTYSVVKHIHQLLNSATLTPLRNHKWRAGAYVSTPERTLTLGGHVHLDVPPPGHGITRGHEEEAYNQIRALDRLTRHFEQLDILPTHECAERRAIGARGYGDTRYGQWGDVRVAGLYEKLRMEYRTMASWLYDPKVTFVCLTGAKLATVAPQVVFDCLRIKTVNLKNLRTLFEFYRHKDDDARRVCENFLDCGQSLQAQPDADLREAWQGPLAF